jgi:hypothetical protein
VTVTASCALSTGDTLLNNAAVVSLTTPDPNAANNTATAVTTAFNPPPVITCPADIVVPNDPGLCSAVVSYDIPVAVDNCPGATVSCTPPPGSVFPKGTTSVSCVATDSGGATGTCGFTVTVNDVEPPKVTCSVGQGRLRPVNHNLVNVGLAVTATDNCPGPLPITVRVASDEDDETQTGDGRFSPDAASIATEMLRLRQERRGDADGRVYLITSLATDESNNTGSTCCTVVVPHSNAKASVEEVLVQAGAEDRAVCRGSRAMVQGPAQYGDQVREAP